MAEKVTAWLAANGQLYPTEEAAKTAELRDAAHFIASAQGEHLLCVCTGQTVDEKTAAYMALLWRTLRATMEKAAP